MRDNLQTNTLIMPFKCNLLIFFLLNKFKRFKKTLVIYFYNFMLVKTANTENILNKKRNKCRLTISYYSNQILS